VTPLRTSSPRLLLSVCRGVTRPSWISAAVVAVGVLFAAGGCGGGEGVAAGATLNVYVSAPLSGAEAVAGKAFCAAARDELRRGGGRAGGVRLRVICLDDTGGSGRWRLAAVGANARRATEDSAAIAYLGEPNPAAAGFSAPILKAAGIGQVAGGSGGAAMAAVMKAVRAAAGSEDPRGAVDTALERR
jgi:hypothetical protein